MAYGYYSSITIDHTQVTASSQTYYRLQFKGGSQFAATSSGGLLYNANGYDVIFSSTNPCITVTPLYFELVANTYSSTTGLGEWWVRIPYPSHVAPNTTIWAVFSNPSITTYQGNNYYTWSNDNNTPLYQDYVAINHWQTTSGQQGYDSTIYTNHITNGAIAVSPGLFGGQAWLAGGSSGAYIHSTPLNFDGSYNAWPGPYTSSCWFKLGGNPGTGGAAIAGVGANGLNQHNPRTLFYITSTLFQLDTGSVDVGFSWTYDTNWHYAVVTFNSTTTAQNLSLYLDGVLKSTTCSDPASTGSCTGVFNISCAGSNYTAGCIPGATGSGAFPPAGTLVDEMRVAAIQLDAGTIATEYNNQKPTSTFYTLGGSQSFSSSGQCVVDIDCSQLTQGSTGLAYNEPVLASNATAPYTYTIIGGGLPPGLTLNASTGYISGVPTANGTYNFTVGVADST